MEGRVIVKEPLVSVIVPVYNVAPYLERCIDSILKQSYHNLEIILVDDGSIDASGILCDKIKLQNDRILVIHKENGGLSSARNAGLDVAKGDYIGFVDSDDFIAENMYKSLVNDIEGFGADIAQCGCEIFWGEKRELRNGTGKVYQWTRDEAMIQHLFGNLTEPSVCCKLYKSFIFKDLRFDESIRLNEDIPFNIYALRLITKSVFRDECFYKYVKRQKSLTRSEFDSNEIETITHIETVLEELADESYEVKQAAKNRLFATYISVYNHSLYSSEDCKDLRKRIKSNLADLFCTAAERKALSKTQRIALGMLQHCEPFYQMMVGLRRKYYHLRRS